MNIRSIAITGAAVAALLIGGVGTAVIVADAAPADPVADCAKARSEALLSNRIVAQSQSYRKDNPAEYAKVRAYLDGGPRPTDVTTHMGLHLLYGEDACRGSVSPPPTTTTPPPTTTTPPPTTTEPPPTTTQPPPGPCALTTANVPDGPDGMGGCFPGPSNTGPNAPASSMQTYTGPCTITAANTVIDSKVVNCRVLIPANGTVIRNSYVNGGVGRSGTSASYTIQDSLIDSGVQYPACSNASCPAGKYACGDPNNQTTDCGVTGSNFTILRTEITNSNRAAFCEANCLVQDSYFHGTNLWPDKTNLAHASSMREQQGATIRHNTLHCSYAGPFVNGEIGCSANLTGYPDFAPIKNNTVDGNLFVANTGNAFCAYGGGTGGKPYSGAVDNATNQKFTNNVFQRGSNGKCGAYGPITDFISSRTGNVWQNNRWDNGTTVPPG